MPGSPAGAARVALALARLLPALEEEGDLLVAPDQGREPRPRAGPEAVGDRARARTRETSIGSAKPLI